VIFPVVSVFLSHRDKVYLQTNQDRSSHFCVFLKSSFLLFFWDFLSLRRWFELIIWIFTFRWAASLEYSHHCPSFGKIFGAPCLVLSCQSEPLATTEVRVTHLQHTPTHQQRFLLFSSQYNLCEENNRNLCWCVGVCCRCVTRTEIWMFSVGTLTKFHLIYVIKTFLL